MLSFLIALLILATLWASNLDLSFNASNLDFTATVASETAHAAAKKIVYGMMSRDTQGLLLCFRTSKKKKPSPAAFITQVPSLGSGLQSSVYVPAKSHNDIAMSAASVPSNDKNDSRNSLALSRLLKSK